MADRSSPDAFMAQRNTPYIMGGRASPYDRMPVYTNHHDAIMYQPQHHQHPQHHHGNDSFVEGALASTSGSSSSASHNVMPSSSSSPWTNHPSSGRGHGPSTPPRTSNHYHHPQQLHQHYQQQQQYYYDSQQQQQHYESSVQFQQQQLLQQQHGNSASRFTDSRVRTSVNPPVHYRTNFGKNCSYFPPATKSSPGRLPPETSVHARRDGPPSPKRLPPAVLENIAKARSLVFEGGGQVAMQESGYHDGGAGYGSTTTPWEEDDVPFDQQRDMFRPPSTTMSYQSVPTSTARNFDVSLEVQQATPPRNAATTSQSDWEQSSPSRPSPLRTYWSETDESLTGRFQISPPRVTDPKPLPQQSKNELDIMLKSMGHEAYNPPTVYSPGPTSAHPSAYHAPNNRFFGRPMVYRGEQPGYDSMEAECSPSRTQESTSLYSPFSQNTRGSQVKWPDDSPRSKNLESPTSRHTATSVHSPKSLASSKRESQGQPEQRHVDNDNDEVANYPPDEQVDSIPVEHAQFDHGVEELDDDDDDDDFELDNPEEFEPDEAQAYQPTQPTVTSIPNALPNPRGPLYSSLISISSEDPKSGSAPSEYDSAETEPFDVSKNAGRAVAPPVIRITEESPFEVEGSWDETADDFPDPEDELPTSSAADETSPQSLRKKHSAQTDDDSIFVFTDDDRNSKQRSPSEKALSPMNGLPRKNGQAVVPSLRRGRRRSASESDRDGKEEDDDDTSLENDYGVASKHSTGLQERAQQAWASRKNVVHRSQSVPAKPAKVVPIPDPDASTAPRQMEEDDITALTGATGVSGGPSFAGSLNSLYSKTLESEVEDAIKDLLLIGTGRATNPGRRAQKFQPAAKRLLIEGRENASTVEDETTDFTNLDDETETMDDTCREEKKEADPIQVMWEYMEGNLSMIGSVFGLSPEAKQESKSKQKSQEQSTTSAEEGSFSPKSKSGVRDRSLEKKKRKSKNRLDEKSQEPVEYTTITVKSKSRDFVDDGDKSRLSTRSQMSEKKLKIPGKEPQEIIEESVELDESTAFGGSVYSAQAESEVRLSEVHVVDTENDDVVDSLPTSPVALSTVTPSVQLSTVAPSVRSTTLSISRNGKLEEDPRLIELAIDAARSLHQLAGVQFDDSGGIDIVEDIRFSIIKLALPLGILFQENNGGCWVTRILPSGNAAKTGGVELGDQLAAVNGVSAIKAKVDEVCTLVSETAESSAVELTFLRYIGPLRALPIETEEDELPPVVEDESKQTDYRQAENIFSCVIGAVKDEPTAQTEPEEEASRPEERPRNELSELPPSITGAPVKKVSRQKNTEGKRRFRLFGLGKKKNSGSVN